MTTTEVLETLDNSNNGVYNSFIQLGHPYSFLIDARINVFRNDSGKWAIAAERLGDNPRAGGLLLQIFYFGNCLVNLNSYNNQSVNYSGRLIAESVNEKISRELVSKNPGAYRATDDELYTSIPRDLKKFLVIDEWYHRDFVMVKSPPMTDDHLKYTYDFNKKLTGNFPLPFEEFKKQFERTMLFQNQQNLEQWENNRPSIYETWQLIAQAIVSGDPQDYTPAAKPNSHWSNWPKSGSL